MTKLSNSSYVNLKDFVEFTKYTMTLAAAMFIYFDKFEFRHYHTRSYGVAICAVAIFCGVVIFSIKARFQGDEIDYMSESGTYRGKLFRIMSHVLTAHIAFVFIAVLLAGYLSLSKLAPWRHWVWPW